MCGEGVKEKMHATQEQSVREADDVYDDKQRACETFCRDSVWKEKQIYYQSAEHRNGVDNAKYVSDVFISVCCRHL